MKYYKILTLSVVGKGNKQFKAGQVVAENLFSNGAIDRLLNGNFIRFEREEGETPSEKTEPIQNRKLRVAICSAVWKRKEIFEMFAKGIKVLQEKTDIEYGIFISGSEGSVSKKMVQKHGFTYIEIPNDPLAAKVNASVYASQDMNPDYILCIGSDDIITPELMKVYETYMRKGIDFIGVTDFYFYDTVSKKAAYWGGYRDQRRAGHTAGAGRLISSRLMKLWNWGPWENKDSKVLDNSMQTKLKITKHSIATFSLKEKGVLALDIKSATNMTPFNLWDNTQFIDTNIIKKNFPYVCAE